MSKINKLFFLFFTVLLIFLIYLLSIGIKTERFNDVITSKLNEQNKNLNAEITDIHIKLDISDLSLKINSTKPVILINNVKIDINKIESNISILSLFSKKPSIKNLIIKTNENNVKDLITILRSYQNTFQTIMLDKLISSGITTSQLFLNFDENGNIKDDYTIIGITNNLKINFFNLDIINGDFSYLIKKNKYSIDNLKFTYNNITFNSNEIEIKKNQNNFDVVGDINNSNSTINVKQIKNLTKINLNKFSDTDIKFRSSNNFSFIINKKFKLNNLLVKSKIYIDKLKYNVDEKTFSKIFKGKNILLNNQVINLSYTNFFKDTKENLLLNGQGEYEIGENKDNFIFEYSLIDSKNKISANINLDNIPLVFDSIGYEKNRNSPCTLSLEARFKKNNHLNFNFLKIVNNSNFLNINDLEISDEKKFLNIKELELNYVNKKKIKNDLYISNNKNGLIINSTNFDGKEIVNKIFDSKNKSIFKNLNKIIQVNFSRFYIDDSNFVENVKGKIKYKNNKIVNLNLDGYLENGEILSIKIFEKNDEVITNVLTNHPKPLVDRYKFIKGFEGGILDFQSIKKKNKSNSLLIIDNFKVKDVPALAKILTLASLQGIADLLTGEGIRFSDFEMKFSSQNNLIEIEELYAIGPAISILMNGYIEKDTLVSLRGTLVPATTINRTISSIPILGNILVGKKVGEGVFGVSFKIKGPPKNLKTTVNPIKTLTPRFITRTLEKIKN